MRNINYYSYPHTILYSLRHIRYHIVMASKEYDAVFIRPKTKKRLKVMCVVEEKTFDEMVEKLINYYEANK